MTFAFHIDRFFLMYRLFSLFITLCIFIWFLPLGAFIKPSQEKVACDGQRAFHMCTCSPKTVKTSSQTSKVTTFNHSTSEPLSKTSSFGGTDILLAKTRNNLFFNTTSSINTFYFKLKSQPFFRSIDHPPKI